jgi:hypothetical protein
MKMQQLNDECHEDEADEDDEDDCQEDIGDAQVIPRWRFPVISLWMEREV